MQNVHGNDPAEEFADTLRMAAQDARVTAVNHFVKRARSASYWLLATAGLFLCFGIYTTIAGGPTIVFRSKGTEIGVMYLSAGAIFLGLYLWARRDPLVPSVIGLVLYVLLVLPTAYLFLQVFWLPGSLLMLSLFDLMRVAFQLRRCRRKLWMSQDTEKPVR